MKQLIHIGVAVSTVGDGREYPEGSPPSGIIPGRANVINIAAACGDAYRFNENIAPASGTYGASPFWAKHQEELEKLKVKPIPLPDALSKFRLWLKQFQGTLVACSSSVDFWHLLHAFFATGKDFPFGTTGLIDTGTLAMVRNGKRRPVAVTTEVDPLHVARARWSLVTEGVLPPFGAKPAPKRKPRPAGTGVGLRREDLRFNPIFAPPPRFEDVVAVAPPPPPTGDRADAAAFERERQRIRNARIQAEQAALDRQLRNIRGLREAAGQTQPPRARFDEQAPLPGRDRRVNDEDPDF